MRPIKDCLSCFSARPSQRSANPQPAEATESPVARAQTPSALSARPPLRSGSDAQRPRVNLPTQVHTSTTSTPTERLDTHAAGASLERSSISSSSHGSGFSDLQSMRSMYKGENSSTVRTNVKYLEADEREAYKVSVQNGLICDATGKPVDTRDSLPQWGTDRRAAIFVMDKKGDMYMAKNRNAQFKHSSFLAGGPVAFAGEMQIEEGQVKVVSNRSGHYLPNEKHLSRVAQELANKGAKPDMIDLIDNEHR
jgi:hypothetical protein